MRTLCRSLFAIAALLAGGPHLHRVGCRRALQGPTFGAALVPHAQPKEARVALVIGNSAYKTSPLRNPVYDAKDTLRQTHGQRLTIAAQIP